MAPEAKKEANAKKKRKASQLLEEREKERERLEQEKQKKKRKVKSETTDKDGYLGVTSENALRFSVADILKKVDHNVELIQQKRGKLLEEENRQRLEAIKRSAEAGKEEREEEQKTHNSAQAE